MANEFILTKENYYSLEANQRFCSASQYKSFVGCPALPSCEARAMAELRGEWEREITDALLKGSVMDALWELTDEPIEEKISVIAKRFPDCVSSKGATKGELKAPYKQVIQMYQRTLRDEMFCKLMSGDKQTIMTGEIEGLPFKIKMDSFVPGVCITDLKTTENCSRKFRRYVADSGNREPFYRLWGYDTQLAIYREVVRQNTGQTLRCYIAAIDKQSHPMPLTIELDPKLLDDALESVKANCSRIIGLKSGEIEAVERCEECDYCRDTYECTIISTSEFEVTE
jgi:hypothetical protein